MPITEFASLSLIPPNKLSDPHVIELFSKVSSWQASSSGYQLCFFTNPDEPAEIHLITGWDGVAAHDEWIKSSRNQELLQNGRNFLNIMGMVHLDLDFSEFPVGVESLICVRFIGAIEDLSEEAKVKRAMHVKGGWTRYGKDVQQSGTGVYYFTESDTLEDIDGDGVDMKTRLKRVTFTD